MAMHLGAMSSLMSPPCLVMGSFPAENRQGQSSLPRLCLTFDNDEPPREERILVATPDAPAYTSIIARVDKCSALKKVMACCTPGAVIESFCLAQPNILLPRVRITTGQEKEWLWIRTRGTRLTSCSGRLQRRGSLSGRARGVQVDQVGISSAVP